MKLTPLMTMHADLKDPVSVGSGPHGDRVIYDVTDGTFEGERLKGKLLASGGDWITIDSDGVGHLDVRATFVTDDGANIYVQYYGALVFNEKVTAALESGIPADFGDTHFVTQPRFETGDDRYRWLNRVMAVAEGRVMGNAVEYRIFEATAD
jgi:hypothetical protein